VSPRGNETPDEALRFFSDSDDRASRMDRARVLVVDDSPFVAKALVRVLEARGLAAVAASTMDEATSVCARLHPDVLVTDVCMPNIDLSDLCRRVRAAANGQRTSVLLFSGHSEQEVRDQIWDARADGFVEKRQGAEAVASWVEALCSAGANRPPR
jgi:two-component system OmpR family response regulator